MYKYLAGRFNILAAGAPDSTGSDTASVVHKPLADLWVRHLLLKRVRLGDSDRTAWRVAATSGVKVTSFDPRSSRSAPVFGPTHILSLRVQATDVDTTIDDPLALFRLRGVLKFDAGDAVTLTATTRARDDVVVLMWGGLKFRFKDNGDGTHTGVFHLPMMGGLGHVGVNALAHGTLFDDTAPYSSQAWVLPYQVKPSLLAEFMP